MQVGGVYSQSSGAGNQIECVIPVVRRRGGGASIFEKKKPLALRIVESLESAWVIIHWFQAGSL